MELGVKDCKGTTNKVRCPKDSRGTDFSVLLFFLYQVFHPQQKLSLNAQGPYHLKLGINLGISSYLYFHSECFILKRILLVHKNY